MIDHMELTQETVGMIQDRLNELGRIYEEIFYKEYVPSVLDAQVREIHALRSALDDLYDELGKREEGVRREWDVEFEIDGPVTLNLTLNLNATDEGIVLDVVNPAGEVVLTEAMMADEWIQWMLDRDEARKYA